MDDISAFGVIHHVSISKGREKEPYVRRSVGDSLVPKHKQTTFKAPDGKTYNVDRKMKSTVVAMNEAGYKTKYSDQGDFRIKDRTRDAYVSVDDPKGRQAEKLRGKLPKRFKVEHDKPATYMGRLHGETKFRPLKIGGDTTVRFRGGPGFGVVNRTKLRREVKKP